MNTMKKFLKYFLNFIVLVLLVSGLTYIATSMRDNKKIEYVAQESNPIIEITECSKKKIVGTATNDMDALIDVIYIKADFYDEDNKLIGTEYTEKKYFNVGEKSKFEIKYNFKDVSKIEVTASENKE